MYSKIIDFEGYEQKNLVLEIAPLESVEDFCGHVDGPWLIVRRNGQHWRQSVRFGNTVLTSCDCCGIVDEFPLPLETPCLCERCKPLVHESISFPKPQHRPSESFPSWCPGDWD